MASTSSAGSSSIVERIPSIVSNVRATFDKGITRPVAWRYAQLRQVIKLIEENRAELSRALKADLGVNDFWVDGVELDGSINEAKDAIAHLATWMKPEKVSTPLVNMPGTSYVQREPFGVVLIISPWNYPVSLLLNPLIASIAAGNATVLKPSEVSVETSRTLSALIPKYFDRDAIAVVEGAVAETTAILKERFDLIMYTGNGTVGRIVMKAASEHLTPVILELGGKCPAIVADDADLKKTARRLAWGKWTMNNGQTCVSPDYILTSPATRPKLLAELKATLNEFYGANPKESKDISRMVNERHCKRVADLLDDKKNIEIVTGGDVSIPERYIAPTILTCGPEAKIMKEEIFGPVLPVVTVDNLDDAISFVNKGEKPLALYVFSENSATAQRTIANTSSGGACVNDVVMHVGNSALPFGGVGPSGMGYYHGKWGFDSFSHKKAVFIKHLSDPSIRFPPYNASKLAMLNRIRSLNLDSLKRPLIVGAFIAVAAVAMRYKF